jgi:predicted unusual protein kinase regulating ubiquinone biosynthesis (AarF/ABC1/UbiB family)
MKFDGHIACLLSNIIVLEGLARELDPDVNIIANALPYIVSEKIRELTSK